MIFRLSNLDFQNDLTTKDNKMSDKRVYLKIGTHVVDFALIVSKNMKFCTFYYKPQKRVRIE